MRKFPKSRDPSRTLTLRNAFVRETNRRFRTLSTAIRHYLVDDDALGYRSIQPLVLAKFEYTLMGSRLLSFLDWLDSQIEEGVLSRDAEWGEKYINSAYKQGRKRAYQELKKGGLLGSLDVDATLDTPLIGPVHQSTLEFLYAREYSALKGVTADMANKMGFVLVEGMANGDSPRDIASKLSRQVGLSLNRARTVARTELMRAHHLATFNTYKEAQIEQVLFYVEWLSAKDDRVCPECGMLDGHVFNLDHMKDTIPLHPNCRCVMIPVIQPAGTELPEPEDAEDWEAWMKAHKASL